MNTPICDFVKEYAERNASRFHMPGHKGKNLLGFEKRDITEIDGADELFTADGIIAESEKNASRLFSSKTFYSAGGSTLCIEAMLHLISVFASSKGKKPFVLAARNAHKAFVNACALLDIQIKWLFPESGASYLSCPLTAERLQKELDSLEKKPTAVYLTSPDYLGNMLDIESISKVCKKSGVLLAVDNAHGAYLKFLPTSKHPIDLGADICCDSAHKTLAVITGGAYLHIADSAPKMFAERAKSSLSLFASSSPSYLILQSLDLENARLENFKDELSAFLPKIRSAKAELSAAGFEVLQNEDMKITLCPKSYGYTGNELSKLLAEENIFPEFYDPDFIVFMLTPQNTDEDLSRLLSALKKIPKRAEILSRPPLPVRSKAVLSPREAIFKESEILPVRECEGKLCASAAISCPPAIPIVVCGEEITRGAVECFEYYGVHNCSVIKE